MRPRLSPNVPTRLPLVVVIGPSGAGKSTLMLNASKRAWPNDWQVVIPIKETTRAARGDAELRETRRVSRETFIARRRDGRYAVSYVVFGEHYGVTHDALSTRHDRAVYLQTFPTSIAAKVKQTLTDDWDVVICLLDTPPAIARERLIKRGDPLTLATLEARMATAGRDRRPVADVVIIGGRGAAEEADDFFQWVCERCIVNSGAKSTRRPLQ